jgi:hypothetical protein
MDELANLPRGASHVAARNLQAISTKAGAVRSGCGRLRMLENAIPDC